MEDFTNAEIGKLGPFTEVDRVFLQEEGRLYRTNAILAILDSENLDFDQAVIEWCQPLPVRDEENRLLGFASVEVKNGRILAEISIDYACPERLSAEIQEGEKFYPRMIGAMTTATGQDKFLNLAPAKRIVKEIYIKNLVLSTKGSDDDRLGPLGEPILM